VDILIIMLQQIRLVAFRILCMESNDCIPGVVIALAKLSGFLFIDIYNLSICQKHIIL